MGLSDAAMLIFTALGWIAAVVFGVHGMATSNRSAKAAQRSADIAAEQYEATLASNRAARQPQVWADIRAREDGAVLEVVVGNSGPTIARDVHVTFDPTLVSTAPDDAREDAAEVESRCHDGLGSLPPGRVFRWSLGIVWKHFPDNGVAPVPAYKVTIKGVDAQGDPLPPLEYVINMEDLKHQSATPRGLASVEAPLKKVADSLSRIESRMPPR